MRSDEPIKASEEHLDIPEDLGLRIGTADQVLWEKVEKECRMILEKLRDDIKVQEAILELAQQKIAIEKDSFK